MDVGKAGGRDRNGETNLFSAAPSALGYLAQVEYALLLTLQRLDVVFDFDVSIETLDDIVFHEAAGTSPPELFQSKHRVDRTASLSDSSPDIWKTLHNWAVEAPQGANLTFLTNAIAPATSAAIRLRPVPTGTLKARYVRLKQSPGHRRARSIGPTTRPSWSLGPRADGISWTR